MSGMIEDGDPWRALRQFTGARIALGRTGISQRTNAQLDFQLGHARARDAVHLALDTANLARALAAAWPELPPPLVLHCAAADRQVDLQRPDLRRLLDTPSGAKLVAVLIGDARA